MIHRLIRRLFSRRHTPATLIINVRFRWALSG